MNFCDLCGQWCSQYHRWLRTAEEVAARNPFTGPKDLQDLATGVTATAAVNVDSREEVG